MSFGKPLLLAALLGIAAGCGGGETGPKRHELSGAVTYKGQPLPAGYIRFEPDSAAGNSGPGAQADIKNGRYKTPSGQGVIGGPHQVTITGTDGIPFDIGGQMNPQGKPLFSDYRTKIDLPKGGTLDFTIPTAE